MRVILGEFLVDRCTMRSPVVVNSFISTVGDKSGGKRFDLASDGLQIFENRLKSLNIAPEIARLIVGRHTDFGYSKGKTIFRAGAPVDMLYCVQRGLVDLYAPTADSSHVLVKIAGPGDLLGNMDFGAEQEQSHHVWDARARSNCQIALISREHIAGTLQTMRHELLIQYFDRINTERSQLMNRWVRFIGLDYRRRLELVIEELAERFGVVEARGTLLTPEFSHSDFAEMIAASRPLVSKLIAELVDRGFLIQQGRQYIVQNKFIRPPIPLPSLSRRRFDPVRDAKMIASRHPAIRPQ
jgi:CRP/FNR family transcriptional regulator